MTTGNSTLFRNRKTAWALLFLMVLIALLVVLVPVWIIQPFRPQSRRDVAASYVMRSWSPIVTIVAALIGMVLVAKLWRGSRRWWEKALLVAVLVPLFASTWFARQNHFEWMFNPLAQAAYAKTTDAGFVADSDIVMAVESNGEAVAYPVRLMAYHHVVQDVVGGTPVVATY